MGHYEQIKGSEYVPTGVHRLNEYATQIALIKHWAAQQDTEQIVDGHNSASRAWVNSGMATKFGEYVENHGDEKIHTEDETKLAELLAALDEPTIH